MKTYYDPPEGWRYGFPKEYKPLTPDEPVETTLARDGYPAKLMELAKWCRFINYPQDRFKRSEPNGRD